MEFYFYIGYDYLCGKNVFYKKNIMIRSIKFCYRNELLEKFEIYYVK